MDLPKSLKDLFEMIHLSTDSCRVTHVYPDVKVEVWGGAWTYNPAAISKVDSDGEPLTPGTSANISLLLRTMFEQHQASDPAEELVNSAAIGDLGKVEEVLSAASSSVDELFHGRTALQAASQHGHIDVVRCLIRYHANLEEQDKDGDCAVHHASFGDEPEIITLLADSHADLNARNQRRQTLLHVAVNKGHVSVMKVLLRNHCHPSLQDSEGDTPLHDAISKKREDMVQLLLVAGADVTLPNNNGFNCLHHASLRGNTAAVRLILQHLPPGCSVDEPKDDGFTALHLASLNNHLEVAQTLIDQGANPDLQNCNKQSPLHLAVERQNIQIVRLLVERGANTDIPDKFGDRPLHEALRHHTMSQLRHLQEDKDISKVMSTADKKGSASIATYLTQNGASIELTNNKGQTPLDLCPDPSLLKLLCKCSQDFLAQQGGSGGKEGSVEGVSLAPAGWSDCLVCSEAERDTLLAPCGHVTTCWGCGTQLKKCLICREDIAARTKIEECLVCSELTASVLFKPCLHMVACDGCAAVMKKCVQCRAVIEQSVPLIVCSGGKPPKRKTSNNRSLTVPTTEVSALQQQLQDMKDKTMCQVCMDRRKNCVFLCGHGTCQLCADKIVECPICRKPVDKKIFLFD